jgi:general secretion pathway protein A
MYERFFNLTAEPFRLSPDHRFCYKYPHYARVRAYMAYALRRAEGFVMLTGPVGSGKTTLISDVVEYLVDERIDVASLVSTRLAPEEMLRMVAFTFGVDARALDKPTILQHLTTRFLTLQGEGRRALLIVDEAQDLTAHALEELRLLTNLEQHGAPLLQVFLLGQPELRDLLRDKLMEPVYQRIIAASHLNPLTEEETKNYVEYRLRVVGWKSDPAISAPVFRIIYRFSEGLPRRINLVCNRLLLQCFVEQRHQVSIADAHAVVDKLQGEKLAPDNLLDDRAFLADDVFESVRRDESIPEQQVLELRLPTECLADEPVPRARDPEVRMINECPPDESFSEKVAVKNELVQEHQSVQVRPKEQASDSELLEKCLPAETHKIEHFFLLGQSELQDLQRDQGQDPVHRRISSAISL